jgi:hypothetical protein
MKKMTKIFAAFGVATVLVLAACTQPTGSGGSNPPASKGFVNISLGIADGPLASVQKSVGQTDSAASEASESLPEVLRTILPGSESYLAFTSYKLVFTPSGGGDSVTLDDRTSLSEIDLGAGTYSLEFTAYTGEKVKAATGSATDITVEQDKTTPVTVYLSFIPPDGGGTGTLAVTVTNSSGLTLTETKLDWKPLSTGGTTAGSKPLSELSAKESLDAGYYLITVTLSGDEQKAVRSDIAHIGAGLETKVSWEFTADKFSTIIDYIRLVGIPTWGEGAPATVAATAENLNGTYTWEVEAVANATFRFILTDTSVPGHEDKWWAGWFHPETNETDVSSVASYQMKFTEGKLDLAWKLSTAGWYTLTVDPYAKTLTVAKPVTVESVAIKNADDEDVTAISLTQGTTDYRFKAVVKGKNVESAQGVTWAISSGVDAGTSIGTDGKLTIDGAETAGGTFTITATSTEDTSKSASVTVTVTNKQAPAPVSAALSNQGVATWVAPSDETGVEKYSVHLYKGSDSVGSAQEVTQGSTYSVNFLSAMRAAGAGSYTVKVKSVGAGTSYSNSPEVISAEQSVSQRTAVEYTWWVNNTVAHWDTVIGSEGATDYTVNVYKGGTKVASMPGANTYEESSKLKAYVDLTSTITTEGPGVYTFGVVTKGNNYLILDAAETKLADESAYKHDVKLTAPTNPTWNGTSAQWDAVANASGYSVQLYKDGSASGAAVSESGTSYGSFDVSAAGSYTFKVIAKGTGTAGAGVYLDSDEATSSAKQVGGAASITLIPLEKQAGTLGVDGGGSASIVKGSGSLTISVTGSDFTSFVWVVDGAVVGGETTSTITLSGANYKLGGHSVTVYALDSDGVPWSPTAPITFTVTAN